MFSGADRARRARAFSLVLSAAVATAGCGGRSVRTLDEAETAGNDNGTDGDESGASACEGLCGTLGSCDVSREECVEICEAASALAEASSCERPYADLVSCYRTLDDFCPTGDSGCTSAVNAFSVCTFDYCLEHRRECRYD